MLCSVVEYRALESCGCSKVTQAAQGAVASHTWLSSSRWVPRHWHYKPQWVTLKKALALHRQTSTVELTWNKCPWDRSGCSEAVKCLLHATGLWAVLSECSAFLMAQHQGAGCSQSKERRVSLTHQSNLQRIRWDKAWASLKVQARPYKKLSSESNTSVALLTWNSPAPKDMISPALGCCAVRTHLPCLPSEGRSKLQRKRTLLQSRKLSVKGLHVANQKCVSPVTLPLMAASRNLWYGSLSLFVINSYILLGPVKWQY